MTTFYRTRHKVSGVIDENTPQHILDAYSDVFEVVGPDAKPFLPEMHRYSLPLDASKDELEVARVAGFTNPGAFQNAIAEHEAEVEAAVEAEVVDEKPADKTKDKS